MLFEDAVLYVATLIALTLAPGPLVLMLMVRAVGNDRAGAIGFSLGMAAGDCLVIVLICLGLGTWMHSAPGVAPVAQAALLVYILWLASKIWRGGFDLSSLDGGTSGSAAGSFCAGAVTCVSSPQTLGLYTLLLPQVIQLDTATAQDFAALSALTFLALAACFGVVIGCAGPIRKLAGSPRSVTLMNRSLALSLVGAGAWMVFV